MPDLNRELAKKIKTKITVDRAAWSQDTWAGRPVVKLGENGEPLGEGTCGTTACVAGWACLLSGKEIDWNYGCQLVGTSIQAALTTDGEHIETVGSNALGLTYDQRQLLFHTYEEDKVLEMLDEIIEEGKLDPNEERWYF